VIAAVGEKRGNMGHPKNSQCALLCETSQIRIADRCPHTYSTARERAQAAETADTELVSLDQRNVPLAPATAVPDRHRRPAAADRCARCNIAPAITSCPPPAAAP
jgi:hypothetical protein